MEYVMIEKNKINGKEVYHRCSTKREENKGARQWRYYICDNCKEHPANSTYLGISTQDYIINRQKENKHIFCTDKEYQEKKVKQKIEPKNIKQLAQDLGMILFNFSNSCENPEHILQIKIKDGLIENTSIIYEDIDNLVKDFEKELKKPFDKVSYEINRLEEGNKNLNILLDDISKVNSKLEEENKTFKFQLQELNQANVNLFNKNLSLEKELEIKEILNQDLVKKYQILQEEIDAYDINMSEMVKKYEQIEQDYKDISKNVLQGLQVKLQHRVKPYLNAGVVNVIIETKEDFK